jgi:peptidoglycan-associated lipoprotein
MIFNRKNTLVQGFAALMLVLALTGSGCSKKQKADEGTDVAADANLLGDSDSGKAGGLQTINFPYDSFTLTGEAKAKLKANADMLKDKVTVKVQIEGHCDQRGGIQYNIALGEKRANAVKSYMEELGVAADRITTISYGKERVLDARESEDAYAKNRRANFVITAR